MMTPPADPTLFLSAGDDYLPTVHTRGPWDPRHQHGGAPAALLAQIVDGLEAPVPMRIVRLSVNLLRPVPLTRLAVRTRLTRPGRRVQFAEAVLLDGEVEVVRAEALRLRVAEVELPEAPLPDPLPHRGPELSSPSRRQPMAGDAGFPISGCEVRFAHGALMETGPATAWIRLRIPVVDGEEPTPVARVAAAADFGNGVSSVLDWSTRLFINPDLGIWLARHPVGQWICIDSTTQVDPAHGSGLAETALWDETGRIGRSVQSLLVDAR